MSLLAKKNRVRYFALCRLSSAKKNGVKNGLRRFRALPVDTMAVETSSPPAMTRGADSALARSGRMADSAPPVVLQGEPPPETH